MRQQEKNATVKLLQLAFLLATYFRNQCKYGVASFKYSEFGSNLSVKPGIFETPLFKSSFTT